MKNNNGSKVLLKVTLILIYMAAVFVLANYVDSEHVKYMLIRS